MDKKPLFFSWSDKYLNTNQSFVQTITTGCLSPSVDIVKIKLTANTTELFRYKFHCVFSEYSVYEFIFVAYDLSVPV
jgi:hypothetical protein